MDSKKIGEAFKLARKKNKLSQKELSELCDIPVISIGRYERGERTPNFNTLIDISKALGIPISAFDSEGWSYYDNGRAFGQSGEEISFSEMINSLYDPFLGRGKEEIINMCEYASKILEASNIKVTCRKDKDFEYLIYIQQKQDTAILFPKEFFVEAEKITWFMKNEISTIMEYNNE